MIKKVLAKKGLGLLLSVRLLFVSCKSVSELLLAVKVFVIYK
jgi:hypothetical protein